MTPELMRLADDGCPIQAEPTEVMAATVVRRDTYLAVDCPRCGVRSIDFDGFGFVHCPACHHCEHPSLSGGPDGVMVCNLCGRSEVRHTLGGDHG